MAGAAVCRRADRRLLTGLSPPLKTATSAWTAFWKLSWALELGRRRQIAQGGGFHAHVLGALAKPSQGILLRASSIDELNATVSAL